ncbi:hypothetical protein MOV61_16905 [Neorhizobium sp. BETTINA12A]|uniref:hypothetical protein n=1 Tax=Neorhizobium sp. BETTINA12A TaxID=2908924 RepID=UPI001FF108E5|nr:hypothetical protein [Neorhizobium sp. BETTINA12A]MCJ9752402.1 hypothetical protein [Neorhizobium sp. BETTINA12A]
MRKQVGLILRIARGKFAHSGSVDDDPFAVRSVGFFEMKDFRVRWPEDWRLAKSNSFDLSAFMKSAEQAEI